MFGSRRFRSSHRPLSETSSVSASDACSRPGSVPLLTPCLPRVLDLHPCIQSHGEQPAAFSTFACWRSRRRGLVSRGDNDCRRSPRVLSSLICNSEHVVVKGICDEIMKKRQAAKVSCDLFCALASVGDRDRRGGAPGSQFRAQLSCVDAKPEPHSRGVERELQYESSTRCHIQIKVGKARAFQGVFGTKRTHCFLATNLMMIAIMCEIDLHRILVWALSAELLPVPVLQILAIVVHVPVLVPV